MMSQLYNNTCDNKTKMVGEKLYHDDTHLVCERVDVVVEGEGDVGGGRGQVARHQARTRSVEAVKHRQVGPTTYLHCLHALFDTVDRETQ